MNDLTPIEDDFAQALRALGHPVRLNILRIIAEKCDPDCCCTDLHQALPLAQSTVSQHIKVLLEAGLISRHPKGTRNCYVIESERVAHISTLLEKTLSGLTISSACCDTLQPESV